MNNFALENNDVISGMQQCSAALAVMGTSYEDAFALFTGAQEIMQDADKVGNGLKSVAMRIRGYSEDVESGEYVVDDSLKNITGDLVELTKVAGDPVLKNGISVYTDDTKYLDTANKKYKSLVQYLGEIADNWDKFSETTQTQLLQKLFAKTQSTTGAAIISNFEQVRKALTAMENSAGSADAEMEKVEETITFKLNKLKEVWVGFLQSAASKELIKDIIDGLTKISEVIIKILETPGLNVAVIGSLLGLIVTKFKDASNAASLFVNIIKSLTGSTGKLQREIVSSSVFSTIANMEDGVSALESLQDVAANTSETVLETGSAIANASSAAGNGVPIIGSLKTAFAGLAAKLGTGALVAWAAAAAAAVAIGIHLYKVNKEDAEYVDNLNSEVEELTSTYNKNKSSIQSTVSSIDSIKDKYQQLAKGVDEAGNNVSLSTEEFSEYETLSKQIGDSFPELISGYSDTGTAILECKDNIELLNEACREEGLKNYLEFATTENLDKLTESIGIALNGREGNFSWNKTYGLNEKKRDFDSFKSEIEEYQNLIEQAERNGVSAGRIATVGKDLSKTGTVVDEDAYAYYKEIQSYLKDFKKYGKEYEIDVSDLTPTISMKSGDLSSNIKYFVNQQLSEIKSGFEESESTIAEEFSDAFSASLRNAVKSGDIEEDAAQTLGDFISSIYDTDKIGEIIGNGDGESQSAAISKFANSLVDNEDIDKIVQGINDLYSIDDKSFGSVGEKQNAIDDAVEYLGELLDSAGILEGEKEELVNTIKSALDLTSADESVDRAIKAASNKSTTTKDIESPKKALDVAQSNMDNANSGAMEVGSDEYTNTYNAYIKAQEAYDKALADSEVSLGTYSDAVKEYLQTLSADQLEQAIKYLNEYTGSFKDSASAIQYLKEKFYTEAENTFSLTKFSETIEQLDSVKEAYDKVYENIKAGKVGKELASDINDVEKLRDTFDSLGNADFGDYKNFDEIEKVLISGTATAEEVQNAWNQLATTLVNAQLAAGDYSKETQALISTQLQEAGATKESADAFVTSLTTIAQAKDVCTQAGQDITNMTDAEIMAFAAEADESAFTKEQLVLLEIAKIACNDATITTVSDIEQLENLMTQAGATTLQLQACAKAKAQLGMADNMEARSKSANEAGNEAEAYQLAQQAQQLREQVAKTEKKLAQDYLDEYKSSALSIATAPKGNSSSSGSGGGGSSSDKDKDKTDKWLEAYEKAYERLGELRDRDKIDEYEYLQYSRALYQKYFDSLGTSNKEWNAYVKLKKQYQSLVKEKEQLAKQNEEASKTSASPEIKEEQENLERLNAEYAELQKQLEEAKEARKQALSDDWMGNVNLNDRPTVGGLAMEQAGWKDAGGLDSYSTVYTNTIGRKSANGSAWVVQFTPILPDGSVLDEQSCLDYINNIIDGAASAEDVMAKDKADKGILFGVFDSYLDSNQQITGIDWDTTLAEAEEYYQKVAELRHEDQADIYATEGQIVEQQQTVQAQIAETSAKIKEAVGDSEDAVKDSTEGTGKSAEEIEEQIEKVQKQLATAEKNMSDDTREYLEKLEEAEYNYLNGMKSLYESVFSWISNKLSDQISKLEDAKSKASDSLEKQKTAAVNALKAEKEAAVAAIEAQIDAIKAQQEEIQKQIDAYQDQIDAHQDEIDAINDEVDAINDANDAREREIALQKALYELDKLNSQRTNLVYSESQGMHYESDLSGIRDARESVGDAKDDIRIANLEKEIDLIQDKIDALQDEIDALEEKKDALDDLIDDLEDQKDAVEDYYDNLIEETEAYWDNLIEESEAYYDSLIENLEKEQNKIEELLNKYELAKMVASIKDLTGMDTSKLWEGLTSGSEEATKQLDSLLTKMATGYDQIITTMEEDNTHVLNTFADLNNIDLSNTTSYIDDTAAAFEKLAAVDFDVVKGGIEGIRTAFSSLGEDSDIVEVLGVHLGEGIVKAIDSAKDSSEVKEHANSAGTETTKEIAKGETSEEAKASLKEGSDEVVSEVGNNIKESVENGDAKENLNEAGKNITSGLGKGMTSDEAKEQMASDSETVKDNTVDSLKESFDINSPSEVVASMVGLYVGLGVGKGLADAANDAEMSAYISQFATDIINALKTAFDNLDTSNIIDIGKLLGLTADEGVEGSTSLSTTIQTLVDSLNALNTNVDLTGLTEQFENLSTYITNVANAIGGEAVGGENGGTSLTQALTSFSNTANQVFGSGVEGGGEENGENSDANAASGGIIGKFATLKTKVNDVTTAIGGGGGEENGESGGGGKGGSSKSGSGEGSSLTQAMEDFGTKADEVLGGGEEGGDDEESGGVIGKFATLKTKVDDVTAAIGTETGEGGGTEDGEGEATLVSALETEEKVATDPDKGLPKQIELWNTLKGAIEGCKNGIIAVKQALLDLYEFSIHVSVAGAGSARSGGSRSSAGHADGTFNVTTHGYADGNVGLAQDQRALVGEVGAETLIRSGRASLIGQHGAEMMNLKKGDIIFSAAQTKELLKNGKIHSRGHAVGVHSYADGTPLNKAFNFAGNETSAATIAMIANQLTGNMPHIANTIDNIERNVTDMIHNVSSVSNVANNSTNVTIGDIHVSGVQDTDSFAKAIKSYLPSKMLQELHK